MPRYGEVYAIILVTSFLLEQSVVPRIASLNFSTQR